MRSSALPFATAIATASYRASSVGAAFLQQVELAMHWVQGGILPPDSQQLSTPSSNARQHAEYVRAFELAPPHARAEPQEPIWRIQRCNRRHGCGVPDVLQCLSNSKAVAGLMKLKQRVEFA